MVNEPPANSMVLAPVQQILLVLAAGSTAHRILGQSRP